jgi:polyisoprenoid-binding protein YceI
MTATQTVAIRPGTFQADKLHSYAGFAVKHTVVATFRAEFKGIDATLVCSDEGLRLEGSVPVSGITIADADLRGHLLSPDFFDVVRTPVIRFASHDLRVDGEGDVVLDGELTIKGVTRPVRARGSLSGPMIDHAEREKFALELETTVDRTAFGLDWNMPLPKGGLAVGNDVKLTVTLALLREEA